jgi:hypothetical protein
MAYPASLRSDRWQLSPRFGGSFHVDSVAAFRPESVATFSGIRTSIREAGMNADKLGA